MTTSMGSGSPVGLNRKGRRLAERHLEGSSNIVRTAVVAIRRPLVQSCLAGILVACGLRWIFTAEGAPVGTSYLVILSTALAAACWYMRGVLGVGFWIALPCSLAWLCHPMCIASLSDPSATISLLPLLLVPAVFAVAGRAARQPGIRAGVVLGAALGTVLAMTGRSGAILVVTAILYAVYEALFSTDVDRTRAHWKLATASLAIAAIVGVFVTVAVPGIASQFGIAMPQPTVAAANTANLTAPFALVDRAGLLASRLGALPEDLGAGGGGYYLGGVILVLCLAAVWPSAAGRRDRRASLLILLAFGVLWFIRGPESLHAQLVRMFEFATLKRHLEPATLQILGLMTIPLAVLALMLFLAVGGMGRGRWTLASVLPASVAALLWWAGSPGELLPGIISASTSAGQAPLSWTLIAFLLVCGAATGFQRLLNAASTRPWRLAVWLIALSLMTVDVQPYAQAAWTQHSASHLQGTSQPAAPISTG